MAADGWHAGGADDLSLASSGDPAAHLPRLGPFALRDYGALGVSGHRWWVTAGSALLGAASHLLLDGLEHAVPAIEHPAHALGAVAMTTLALIIGRRRLLRRWHGVPPPRERRHVRFWSMVAAVALPALAVIPFLPAAGLLHTTGVRVLTALAAALLLAAAVAGTGRPVPDCEPGRTVSPAGL